MLAALVLLLAVASPAPMGTPYPFAAQTPPPEPNHVTIELVQSFVETGGNQWENGSGVTTQVSGRYEFQAGAHARFANTLHWERLSSSWTAYDPAYGAERVPFAFNLYDDEFDAELGRPDYPWGVGIGYYDYAPVYDGPDTYDLAGFGIGVDRWPNYYMPSSFYYSAWYYNDVHGSQRYAGAYAILRLDAGWNVRKSLVSPWNLRIGFQSESWFAQNRWAADTSFNGPYLSLSYWK